MAMNWVPRPFLVKEVGALYAKTRFGRLFVLQINQTKIKARPVIR